MLITRHARPFAEKCYMYVPKSAHKLVVDIKGKVLSKSEYTITTKGSKGSLALKLFKQVSTSGQTISHKDNGSVESLSENPIFNLYILKLSE